MIIDPLSLKLFVTIVEEGTIARAAEREHIAASAVSKRMSELEEHFGTALLRRTNKGVVPTDAGITLLQLARGVLHDMNNLYVQISEYSSGVRGHPGGAVSALIAPRRAPRRWISSTTSSNTSSAAPAPHNR